MTLAYIGLGKMGKNMVLRLLEQGQEVVVWNRSKDVVKEMVAQGAIEGETIPDLISRARELANQRKQPLVVWNMLLQGEPTEEVIMQQVLPLLQKGEIVIDGANANWHDTVRREPIFRQRGVHFIDVGVSGGPAGARNGACLMIGGEESVVKSLDELWGAIAAPTAYGYFGKTGAGHFVKMVHNGIEYGMMQAIGEGFELMKRSDLELDLKEIVRIYNTGSVIESRLIGWLGSAYEKYGVNLEPVSGSIGQLGEGRWTVETAKEMGIPVPIIEGSLEFRNQSNQNPSYTGKVVSALRGEFGGHDVKQK